MSKFGRYAVAEPPHNLGLFHHRDPESTVALKEVDHEPAVEVLDQEDLDKQGIDTSVLIPGAPKVVALGSCVFNTAVEATSNAVPAAAFNQLPAKLGLETVAELCDDTRVAEECAIVMYHQGTDQTGDPSQEWPPTDCGSSGVYMVELLKKLGVIHSQRIAHGPDNVASLLQKDGVCVGSPFLNAWMEPGADGFVDGNGKLSTVQHQIQLGVAGGHEYYLSAIEKLVLLRTGAVDPWNTVIRFRNHWTKSWGDHGSGRMHLSTLTLVLASYADFRQLVA